MCFCQSVTAPTSLTSVSCIFIRSISAYCWVATFMKLQWWCIFLFSLRVTCVHDKWKTGKVFQERMGRDFRYFWHTWPCLQWSCRINYLHHYVTLTVLLARLLLWQFLLCCDFQHRQAPAGFQLLWFVADDGTILTLQFAASNHSNRKGGELYGSWAHSQVMSSFPLTTSPASLSISQAQVH